MSQTKIIIKNAILITLLIGGLFFFSKLIGQEANPYLRFLNIIFVIFGIKQAVKNNLEYNNDNTYTVNFGIALGTSILGVILSTIGVIFYITLIDPQFLSKLGGSFLIGGSNLNIYELIFTLMIEGIASSVVGSLIIMQYFKKYKVPEKV